MTIRARRFSLTLVLTAASTSLLHAAPPRDHTITADDYFTIAVITDLAMSPDGKSVAYVEQRWEPPAETRNSDLWVVDAKNTQPRRLTFDSATDSAPHWSSDSAWLYFTSNPKRAGDDKPPYNGKTQVWRIDPRSGPGAAAQPVTRVASGIKQFDLSADGQTLFYTVSDEDVDDPWSDLKKKYKKLEYGEGPVNVSQVWKLDLRSWRAEKLIDDKRVIGAFSVAGDGKRIAMITTPTEQLITNEGRSRVDIYDAETKKITPLPDKLWRADAPSPYGWIESPCWTDDGLMLAFRVGFDGYPAEAFIATFASGDVSIQKLPRPAGVHLATVPMTWRGTSHDLCYVGEMRARARVYCTPNIHKGKPADARVLTPGDVVCANTSFSHNGREFAVILSDPTHPPDVFTMDYGSEKAQYARLTTANPQIDTWKLPSIQLVTWKGWNGDEVEGILELPPDHKPGQPLPMIVELHGGPTASTLMDMRFWIYGRTLLPARGYALLSPNYRGSTGYGDKFMTELVGHENEREVEDILKGVDAMVEKGVADADKLGVMGWSNGGYLTNCLITHTPRFKAASSGAGISDMVMQWSIEDTPGHVINFHEGGFPWTKPEDMRKTSPLFAADKIKTPTLFHVGGDDSRCPPPHQKALYRALHEYLNVPAELVVYPGEGHGLLKYENRKAKMEWDIAWFDRHILGHDSTPPPPNRAREEASRSATEGM